MHLFQNVRPTRSAPNAKPSGRKGPLQRIRAAATDAVLRNSVSFVFDQAVVSGTNFVICVIIGRMCSQQEFGIFYLALTIVLVLRNVQSELVSSPYMIYCSRKRGEALASYTGSTLVHQLVISALSMAGLLVLAGILSFDIAPAGLSTVVWPLLGAVPFLLLREYLRQLAFAHLRPMAAIVLDLAVAVMQLGGLLLLGWLHWLSVESVYLVMGAACAVASCGWFLTSKQPLRFDRSQFIADWRHNWSFSKWALSSHLVGSAVPYLLPWILALTHGSAATGILAACTTLVGVTNMFVTGVSNFLTPRAARAFAEGGVEELRRVLGKTATLFAAALGVFCLIFVTAGDLLATLIYGDRYAETGLILSILAVNALVHSLGVIAGNGLWALDRPRSNFQADVCALIAALAVAVCLISSLGVFAAALSLLLGTSVGTAVRCLTLQRSLESVPFDSSPV
jgi:O-antigen/teichoic acid export membrane protein